MTTQQQLVKAAEALPTAEVIASVVLEGDLSKLSKEQLLAYYNRTCESVGLNPLTQPFRLLRLSGKLVLYAGKDCTDQLRKLHGVSVERVDRDVTEGMYVVTAYVKDKTGRVDSEIGAVPITGLKGENLANAMMKTITKAKRRATLSICGLGMLDETEVGSIPGAQVVAFDPATGEIHDGALPSTGKPAILEGPAFDDGTPSRSRQTYRVLDVRDGSTKDTPYWIVKFDPAIGTTPQGVPVTEAGTTDKAIAEKAREAKAGNQDVELLTEAGRKVDTRRIVELVSVAPF